MMMKMMMHDDGGGGGGVRMMSITVSFGETIILIAIIIQLNSTHSVGSTNVVVQQHNCHL